ncbi:MAG: methyltransferase domain-containing protein [Phycisphaerae bacterium]|nr:methyltransferase domain-containing protein [Phycisphaerae bacterium]
MPAVAVEAFAGVSNVSMFADIPADSRVLDLGCGAGLDTLIAAQRTAANGRVIAVDFSDSMLDRARRAVTEAGTQNVDVRKGDAEELPAESASIDVVIINGIFNLNPAREAIFRELARVVRTNGRVFAAELILKEPLPENERRDVCNWFA